MQCVLVRHGEASWDAPSDAERNLTERGHACVKLAAEWLSANYQPDKILVSPYRRAQQTAQYFMGHYPASAVESSSCLTPDTDLQLMEKLLEQQACERLLLIGHNPLFSNALTWFCGRDVLESMAPASMALIDLPIVARDSGCLRWVRHAPNYEIIVRCQ